MKIMMTLMASLLACLSCKMPTSQNLPSNLRGENSEQGDVAGADGSSKSADLIFSGCSLTVLETVQFKGKISVAGGSPLARALVSIYSSAQGKIVATGQAENSGKYSLIPSSTFCKSGSWAWVCASSDGYQGKCQRVVGGLLPQIEVNLQLDVKSPSLPVAACKYDAIGEFQSQAGGCQRATSGLVYGRAESALLKWSDAKKYCDTLTQSNFSDWRLPAKAELSSILGPTSRVLFNFSNNIVVWTASEIKAGKTAYAGTLSTGDSLASHKESEAHSVICVRDGI